MAFKMKRPSIKKMVEDSKKKKKLKDPYTPEDYKFLREQREERVNVMDYLSKTPRGPVETENKKRSNIQAYIKSKGAKRK
jgi:hypothetical protein|tara:strand:- start:237 stop:476 length:240 start_codon:yes stop_codon:yes gene_type:complete